MKLGFNSFANDLKNVKKLKLKIKKFLSLESKFREQFGFFFFATGLEGIQHISCRLISRYRFGYENKYVKSDEKQER